MWTVGRRTLTSPNFDLGRVSGEDHEIRTVAVPTCSQRIGCAFKDRFCHVAPKPFCAARNLIDTGSISLTQKGSGQEAFLKLVMHENREEKNDRQRNADGRIVPPYCV
jgi:hypothetical protein